MTSCNFDFSEMGTSILNDTRQEAQKKESTKQVVKKKEPTVYQQ